MRLMISQAACKAEVPSFRSWARKKIQVNVTNVNTKSCFTKVGTTSR